MISKKERGTKRPKLTLEIKGLLPSFRKKERVIYIANIEKML